MKKYLRLLVLTILGGFLLHSAPARADHLMGSDITWKCIGGDTFVITVTVYRDCAGISMPPQPFTISGADKGCTSTTVSVSSNQSKGVDITPVCGKSCDRCGKVPNTNYGDPTCKKFLYGVEMYTFTAKVIFNKLGFKKGCCHVSVTWDQCCRSGTLTAGGNWQNFHVEATMNRCLKPCDNSPQFSNPPVVMICQNQCFSFNPGMTDVDVDANGNPDSLVYSLAKPMTGSTTAVTYTGKYSYDKPLYFDSFPKKNALWNPPSCSGFHLDSFTGDLQFEPTKVEQTVMTIQVQEYTKDTNGKPILKGTTRRDFQIIVMKCPNNHTPTLTGINGTNSTDDDFCVNESGCFTINSNDQDVNDTVSVNWNKALAAMGATFVTETKKQHPRSTFCWTPKPAQAGHTYQFVVTAKDDACPLPGRTQRSYRIHVHAAPAGRIDKVYKGCGNYMLKFKLYPGSKKSGVAQWTGDDNFSAVGDSFQYHFRQSGKWMHFQVTVYNQYTTVTGIKRCTSIIIDSVYVPPYVYISIPHDTVLCKANATSFPVYSFTSGGIKNYVYHWSTGDTIGSTKVNMPNDTTVYVTVQDSNGKGCINSDTMHVHLLIPLKPVLGPDQRVCSGNVVYVNDQASRRDSVGYTWYSLAKPSLTISDSSSLIIKDSGSYVIQVNDAKLKTCYNKDTINVFINQPVDVVPQKINACANTPLTLDAGNGVGDTNAIWKWYDVSTGGALVHSGRIWKNVMVSTDKFYKIVSFQKYNNVICGDTDTFHVFINPMPANNLNNIPNQCYNNPPVDLSVYTSTPGGVWKRDSSQKTPGKYVTNGHFYPDSAGKGAHRVFYITTDPKSGCKNSQMKLVSVDTLPIISVKTDSYQCIDAQQPFDLNSLNPTPSGGTWSGPAITNGHYFNQNDPNAGGAGVKHFTYSFQNKLSTSHCTGKKDVTITVYPVIHPNGGQDQSVCKNASPITLLGNLDTTYHPVWYVDSTAANPTPSRALQATSSQYPLFRPDIADTGVHLVIYEGSFAGHRCPYTSTVKITVSPNPAVSLSDVGHVCLSSPPVTLDGKPLGGSYIIDGNVGGKIFYPDKAGVGPHTVTYRYIDRSTSAGCDSARTITITVDTPAYAKFISYSDTCVGTQVRLKADFGGGATGLEWSHTGNGTYEDPFAKSDNKFNPGKDSIFTLYIKGTGTTNSCPPPKDSVTITLNPYPVASFNVSNGFGCTPLFVNLMANKSFIRSGFISSYEWSFGDNSPNEFGESVKHTYSKDTTMSYRVSLKVTSDKGCTTYSPSQNIQTSATPRPWFTADPFYTTILLPDISFTDYTTINDPALINHIDQLYHRWDFGDGYTSESRTGPVHTYNDTGVYTVKLFVRNPSSNCEAETTRVNYIDIRPELLVFIPNAFTPNHLYNDKTLVNEKFTPVISNYSAFKMEVFSRWGELLYETTDLEKGWDGTYNGKTCQEGVYIYRVQATSMEGKTYKYSGSITLLR